MAVTSGPLSTTFYIGLSTDTKPAIADFASFFYEPDTGRTFIFTGSNIPAPATGQWVEYLPLYPTPFFDPSNPNR
jgi:hypothetical protein